MVQSSAGDEVTPESVSVGPGKPQPMESSRAVVRPGEGLKGHSRNIPEHREEDPRDGESSH